MREIDTISVRGETETTRVFEIMSIAGQLSEESARVRQCYDQARAMYLAQQWDMAEMAFHECLKARQNDGPSRVLLERIHFLRRNPPGTIGMTFGTFERNRKFPLRLAPASKLWRLDSENHNGLAD